MSMQDNNNSEIVEQENSSMNTNDNTSNDFDNTSNVNAIPSSNSPNSAFSSNNNNNEISSTPTSTTTITKEISNELKEKLDKFHQGKIKIFKSINKKIFLNQIK